MIGWKKVVCDDGNQVELKLRVSKKNYLRGGVNEENIASKAFVLAIYDEYGYKTGLKKARSVWRREYEYKVGTYAIPANGSKGGIWFWRTLKEAICYEHDTKFEWFEKKALRA